MSAGIEFTLSSNLDELKAAVRDIRVKAMPSEASKALNRTVTFVRNEVSQEVSGRTGIPQPLIKRRIKLIKASRARPNKLSVSGFVGEAPIPVSKLSPKPRKAGTGATYKTIVGQPIDAHAFFATLKNGKKTAWIRKTKKRGSMREVQIKIGPLLRRSTRRVSRAPAKAFFLKTFVENMEKRVEKDIEKRGLKR